MSSWLRCRCGNLVHTNLFCGTGISVLVGEERLDEERTGQSAEEFISEMIQSCNQLLHCRNCGRLIVVDGRVARFYALDEDQ